MTEVLVVEKTGNLKSVNVKKFKQDEFYKLAGFKNNNKDYTKLISKYFMLYTISLIIHVQINLFFVTQLESYKFFIEISYAIATGVSALINFIGLKVLVFKEKD